MKAAYARLAIVLALFVGWLGYLGYLVYAERGDAYVVLSRPQFAVSDVDVIADVNAGSDVVTVDEVLFPKSNDGQKLVGKQIRVTNLEECRPAHPPPGAAPRPDLNGNGKYLLPLQEPVNDDKDFRVCPTPPSPGFEVGTPRIYPATEEVMGQYRQIVK